MTNLSNAEQHIANYMPDDVVKLVQEFVDENITADNSMTAKKIYAALKGQFKLNIKEKANEETAFCNALSCNVRGGKITGIQGKRKVGYVRVDPNATPKAKKPKEPKSEKTPIDDIITNAKHEKPPVTEAPEERTCTRADEGPIKGPESPPEAISTPDPIPAPQEEKRPLLAPPPEPTRRVRVSMRHVWIDGQEYRVPMLMKKIHSLVNNVLMGHQKEGGPVVFDGKGFDIADKALFKRFLEFHGAIHCGQSEPVLDDGSGIPVELRI